MARGLADQLISALLLTLTAAAVIVNPCELTSGALSRIVANEASRIKVAMTKFRLNMVRSFLCVKQTIHTTNHQLWCGTPVGAGRVQLCIRAFWVPCGDAPTTYRDVVIDDANDVSCSVKIVVCI